MIEAIVIFAVALALAYKGRDATEQVLVPQGLVASGAAERVPVGWWSTLIHGTEPLASAASLAAGVGAPWRWTTRGRTLRRPVDVPPLGTWQWPTDLQTAWAGPWDPPAGSPPWPGFVLSLATIAEAESRVVTSARTGLEGRIALLDSLLGATPAPSAAPSPSPSLSAVDWLARAGGVPAVPGADLGLLIWPRVALRSPAERQAHLDHGVLWLTDPCSVRGPCTGTAVRLTTALHYEPRSAGRAPLVNGYNLRSIGLPPVTREAVGAQWLAAAIICQLLGLMDGPPGVSLWSPWRSGPDAQSSTAAAQAIQGGGAAAKLLAGAPSGWASAAASAVGTIAALTGGGSVDARQLAEHPAYQPVAVPRALLGSRATAAHPDANDPPRTPTWDRPCSQSTWIAASEERWRRNGTSGVLSSGIGPVGTDLWDALSGGELSLADVVAGLPTSAWAKGRQRRAIARMDQAKAAGARTMDEVMAWLQTHPEPQEQW